MSFKMEYKMSCGNIHPIICDFKSHDQRVSEDIPRCTAVSGYNFENVRNCLQINRNYTVRVHPFYAEFDGFEFNGIIDYGHRGKFILVSGISQKKRYCFCNERASVELLIINGYTEREKNIDRERLRSVGIEPTW